MFHDVTEKITMWLKGSRHDCKDHYVTEISMMWINGSRCDWKVHVVWLKGSRCDWKVHVVWLKGSRCDWKVHVVWLKGSRCDWKVHVVWLKGSRCDWKVHVVWLKGSRCDWKVHVVWLKGSRCDWKVHVVWLKCSRCDWKAHYVTEWFSLPYMFGIMCGASMKDQVLDFFIYKWKSGSTRTQAVWSLYEHTSSTSIPWYRYKYIPVESQDELFDRREGDNAPHYSSKARLATYMRQHIKNIDTVYILGDHCSYLPKVCSSLYHVLKRSHTNGTTIVPTYKIRGTWQGS